MSPIDYRHYPKDWREVRARILARAGNVCEWCGAANHQPHPVTGSPVVLTIAHLDATLPDGRRVSKHDKSVTDPAALAALCQRCHLAYDRGDHVRHAAETRRRRRRDAGQVELFATPLEETG